MTIRYHNPADSYGVNPQLIALVRDRLNKEAQARSQAVQRTWGHKRAFVPSGDPSMMGGAPPMDPSMGGGAPMDPSMMGGAPPMDPSMMGGAPPMDPSMMGGAPPMDPSMMGGMPPPPSSGGGGDMAGMSAKLDQMIQLMQGGGVGGQSGANQAGMLKPKIDINVEILKMNKMLARIADALNIHIPAYEMVATPQDLTSMAQQQQGSGQQDAAMGGGKNGAIPPMGGMEGSGQPGMKMGSTYQERGAAYNQQDVTALQNKAMAISSLLRRR